MEFKIPISTVDSITWTTFQGYGFIRTIVAGIIQYRDKAYGTIILREIDVSTTEITISYPNYPQLTDVLPLFEASRMESNKIISGIDYPDYAKQKLEEEYQNRIKNKQQLVNAYTKRLTDEEHRIQETPYAFTESKNTDGDIASRPQKEKKEMAGKISAEEKIILDLWRESYPASEIAREVDISPGRINNLIVELRKRLGVEKVPYHGKKR